MLYAMTIHGYVIDVVESETKPKWPPTIDGTMPIAIECGKEVERGMIYDEHLDTFLFPISDDFEEPTQLDNIEATQLTIMTAMAEQYEESLERELVNMEVQATIYEAILEMGGAV